MSMWNVLGLVFGGIYLLGFVYVIPIFTVLCGILASVWAVITALLRVSGR